MNQDDRVIAICDMIIEKRISNFVDLWQCVKDNYGNDYLYEMLFYHSLFQEVIDAVKEKKLLALKQKKEKQNEKA